MSSSWDFGMPTSKAIFSRRARVVGSEREAFLVIQVCEEVRPSETWASLFPDSTSSPTRDLFRCSLE